MKVIRVLRCEVFLQTKNVVSQAFIAGLWFLGFSMRVLQVLHQFLPHHVGGVEIYARNLSKRLVRLGNEVALFSGEGRVLWNPVQKEEKLGNLQVTYLIDERKMKKNGPIFFRTFRNSAVLDMFDQALSDFDPDVVHLHHTMYLSGDMVYKAKSRGIPVVLTVHDFWFLCHRLHMVDWVGNQCNGPKNPLKCAFCLSQETHKSQRSLKAALYLLPLIYRTRYQYRILRSVDAIIAPAWFLVDVLKGSLGSEADVTHIPYGIASDSPHTHGRSDSKIIRFAYLGTIKQHKGLQILIDAFNKLDGMNVTLSVYGDTTIDPSFCSELRRSSRSRKVFFKGAYGNQDLPKVMKEVDVLIVPSIWRETGPLVILEALAYQKPVIAADLGGMAELIRNGENGFLFPHGNSQSLIECISKIVNQPSILGELSPKMKDEYTIEHNANSVLAIYENLLAPKD